MALLCFWSKGFQNGKACLSLVSSGLGAEERVYPRYPDKKVKPQEHSPFPLFSKWPTPKEINVKGLKNVLDLHPLWHHSNWWWRFRSHEY